MPTRDRFEFALKNIKPSQWEAFEELASSFLVSEFPDLRTMASPSGDGGRDSELFSDSGFPSVAFQYSVTEKWHSKIKNTTKRIEEEFSNVSVIRYVTNQVVGAKADSLKSELLKSGKILDIYDQSWFLDRVSTDSNRSAAAERLCDLIVDPILAESGVIDKQPSVLSSGEMNVALFYLDMQRADDRAGKNLTRSCYEALVKAALAGTSKENTMSRDEVYKRVGGFLPRYEIESIKRFIDNALNRLKRREINSWNAGNYFCLNHHSIERIKDIASERLITRSRFESEISEVFSTTTVFKGIEPKIGVEFVFRVLDEYFLRQGERFASAIMLGEIPETPVSGVELAISSCPQEHPLHSKLDANALAGVILDVLSAPSPSALQYLQARAHSYTLLAFLSETPDVQVATNKLFSSGVIWLDTTVLLPLIPESTAKSGERPFTDLFRRAKKAGISLRVTYGVIEEIERHLNRCRAYSRSDDWTGYVPYVYQRYVLWGGTRDRFSSWLERFMGNYRPEEDIADFIRGFEIEVGDPESGSELPEALISGVQEFWQEVHFQRRGEDDFNLQANRLAQHDIENVLSVLIARKRETGKEGVGFRTWWLTLDAAAYKMSSDPAIRNADREFKSPVMSLDFLLKYLAFGPARDVVYNNVADNKRIFAPEIFDNIPAELMSVAEEVRKGLADLDMHIVKRRVRDELDKAREGIGAAHRSAPEGLERELDEFF